jgi:hypothetical protein
MGEGRHGGVHTTTTAGMPYFPLAAALRIEIALLFWRGGMVGEGGLPGFEGYRREGIEGEKGAGFNPERREQDKQE